MGDRRVLSAAFEPYIMTCSLTRVEFTIYTLTPSRGLYVLSETNTIRCLISHNYTMPDRLGCGHLALEEDRHIALCSTSLSLKVTQHGRRRVRYCQVGDAW